MTHRRIIEFVIAAIAALIAIALYTRAVRQSNVSAPAPQTSQVESAAAVDVPELSIPSGTGTTTVEAAVPRKPDHAAQLRAAADYLEFVRTLLPTARAGDHAAQYYIHRALDYCGDGYRAYFDRGRVRRTLDDALRWAAARPPLDPEEIRRVYERCHTMMESGAKELDETAQWLNLAAQGGYPLAQVRLARELESGRGRQAPSDTAELREEVRQLAGAALRSREPEVIWEMAELTGAGDSVAWMVAACLRGMDCSPQARHAKWLCSFDQNCQPYESVVDIIQRQLAGDFPAIEARARWISENIDAGDWEALGF